MTNTLQSFSPAAALLILKGDEPKLAELLKLTFFDLVHRNILQVTEEEIVNRQPSKPTKVLFVQLGSAAGGFRPLPHEEPIIKFFLEQPQTKMLFQTVVKLAHRNAFSHKQFTRKVIRQAKYQAQFHEGFWHRITGGFGLSDEGLRTRLRMNHELNALFNRIAGQKTGGADDVSTIVKGLGAYALLIPGLDLSQFQLAKEGFNDQFAPVNQGAVDTYPSYVGGGCSSMDSWSSMSATFDHSGHGHGHGHGDGHGWGSDGDSGCGGDSGGGDSGCGGGGCGGGGCGGGCGGCGS